MKALIEEFKKVLNFHKVNEGHDVIFHYSGTADVKALLKLPDGTEKEADHIKIYLDDIPACSAASYDSNIYGLDAPYAVGGYTGGEDIDYTDLDHIMLDDDEAEKWPEGTEVKKVIQVYDEDVEVIDEVPYEYEPDYDPAEDYDY